MDGTGQLDQQSMGHFCKRARNSGSSEGHQAALVETRFWGTGMQSLNSRNGARSTLIVIDAATEHSWEADCG